MHKPLRDLQINFEPPSDFVGESASGGRRWFKWVGIGCAGITLIFGLIMAFGGFKVVSCCTDLVETTRLTIATEAFAREFSSSIQNKDYKTAYAMTNVEEFQSKTSLGGFTAQFSPHETLLARSMPVVSNISAIDVDSDKDPRWDVHVRLLPPDGDEMLTMTLKVGGSLTAGGDPAETLEVFAVTIDRRKRDLTAEAPAVAAVEFHELLGRGEYEEAYKHLGRELLVGEPEEDADVMNEEAFKVFIKDNDQVLTRKITEVVRVQYADSNQAEVVVRVVMPDQSTALITYNMVRLGVYNGWRTLEIKPELEARKMPVVGDAESKDSEVEDQAE